MDLSSPLSPSERTDLLLRAWELKRSGDHAALIALLEPLPDAELVAEPELAMVLLHGYSITSRYDDGERLMSLVRERCLSDDRLKRRYLNFEAIVHGWRGRLHQAEESFIELERMARLAGDDATQCFATTGLAIVYAQRCEYHKAVMAYYRALPMTPFVAEGRWVGPNHHNLAMAYRELGWYAEAQRHFEEAAVHVRGASIAMLELERAVMMVELGELSVAEVLARRGIERYVQYGSVRGQADGMRVQAKVLIGRGDLAGARQLLLRAWELFPGDEPMLEAEICEETAVVELLAGKEQTAAVAAAAAERAYLAMEAPLRVERMRARFARLETEHPDVPPPGTDT